MTGTNHYAVGVKARLTDSVFESHSFLGRNLDRIPEGAFEKEFLNLRVHEVYQAETINEAVEKLERKMLTALNVVAPENLIRTRENYAKWMTPELLAKIKHQNGLRKRAERSKIPEHW